MNDPGEQLNRMRDRIIREGKIRKQEDFWQILPVVSMYKRVQQFPALFSAQEIQVALEYDFKLTPLVLAACKRFDPAFYPKLTAWFKSVDAGALHGPDTRKQH